MFINRTKKFIFLRVTKTGSTSILNYLINNIENDNVSHGSVEQNDHFETSDYNCNLNTNHLNINELIQHGIISKEELLDYNIYGVIRNPIDRFISACYHIPTHKQRLPNIENMSINECVEKNLVNININNWTMLPQAYWLLHENTPINKLFLYENLSGVVSDIFNKSIALPFHHRSTDRPNKSYDIDIDLKNEIIRLYKTDNDLYVKTLG